MKMGISLLQQYQLLYTNDSIPQINNYAVLLIEIQEPDLALSALQKLAQIIKEYNSTTVWIMPRYRNPLEVSA